MHSNIIKQFELMKSKRHRQMLWFQLPINDARYEIDLLIQALAFTRIAVLSDNELFDLENHLHNGFTSLKIKQAKQLLGLEYDLVIYDGYSGLNADALGASIGSVTAGGAFIMVSPHAKEWCEMTDKQNSSLAVYPSSIEDITVNFTKRFCAISASDNGVTIADSHEQFTTAVWGEPSSEEENQCLEKYDKTLFKTVDQFNAFNAIEKVVKGRRNRPLVMTADRGRGKSSVLGLAAGRLLADSINSVAVVAPNFHAVQPVFENAATMLELEWRDQQTLEWSVSDAGIVTKKSIYFVPPDKAQHHIDCDLMLVDEAAAIPSPVLTNILQQQSRVAFSTTIHGYEGTGRGFEVRFKNTLNELKSDWKQLNLKQPIRWAEGCPLESWQNELLLLAPEPMPLPTCELDEVYFATIEHQTLVEQPNLLSQIFELLVLAHYQTSPQDLKYLLDSPNLDLHIGYLDSNPVAVSLVSKEGLLDETIAKDILHGKRRPLGHLIPQTLITHCGFENAGTFSYARVVRIAVEPRLQKKQLGTQLLTYLQEYYQQLDYDFMATSFGCTPGLLDFWSRANYTPARLGFNKDAASGEHSIALLSGLNDTAKSFQKTVSTQFIHELPYLLADQFSALNVDLVIKVFGMFQLAQDQLNTLTAKQNQDIELFAEFNKDYGTSSVSLQYFVLGILKSENSSFFMLSKLERQIVIQKILQKKTLEDIVKHSQLTGRKQFLTTLKQAIKRLSNC